MDKVIRVFEDDMDVVVQPAVNWIQLNQQLAPTGLFFPVDPGPTAQFGGMVGTNCSGTNAFRYGPMKDWVLNLTVVCDIPLRSISLNSSLCRWMVF